MADYLLNSGTFVDLSESLTAAWLALTVTSQREIEICNLALSHIGETSRVTSIAPPDGSAQAAHCARFYPIARDILLERHAWDFTKRQVKGTVLTNDRTDWDYKYEWIEDASGILWQIPEDLWTRQAPFLRASAFLQRDNFFDSAEYPFVYSVERDDNGVRAIYSNTLDAIFHYSSKTYSPDHFSDLFVQAVSYDLASMLAGPIVKGEEGSAKAKEMLQIARVFEASAQAQDSQKRRRHQPERDFAWDRGR